MEHDLRLRIVQEKDKRKQRELLDKLREIQKKQLLNQAAVRTVTQKQVAQEMRETLGMMDAEINKSIYSLDELQQSNKVLKKTDDIYGTMDGLLKNSKKILIKLQSKDRTDRILLASGLVIFLSTVMYLIWKRL